MGCSDKTVQVRRCAWSDGTTTAIFLGAAQFPVKKTGSVRVSMDVEATTGSLELRRAIRFSNDGITWTSPPTEFGAAFTAASGDAWGEAFQATDSAWQIAEVGVMAKNANGVVTRQQAQINFVIDTREP
jgi:hypothetical protein